MKHLTHIYIIQLYLGWVGIVLKKKADARCLFLWVLYIVHSIRKYGFQ